MSREFDDVLNDCLERIARGEDLRECASRYPEYEDELAPLLSVAAATMQVAASATYPPQAKARGLDRLAWALANKNTSSNWIRIPSMIWRPLARPTVLALAAVFLVVVAAGGTTVASSNSVPGDPLYWVKTTKENVSLKVIPRSDESTAQAHAHLANVRGQELQKIIARGRFKDTDLLMERINFHLNKSAAFAGLIVTANPIEMPLRPRGHSNRRNTNRLKANLERDERTLNTGLGRLILVMPPDHQARVRRLMRKSELRYRILIEAMENGRSPGRVPYWRFEPPRPTSR